MQKTITVRQAGLLRLATWSAGEGSIKRDLFKLRQEINAQLQPLVDAKRLTLGDMGAFSVGDPQDLSVMNEPVTLSFSSVQWGALNVGMQTMRWPMLSEVMEQALFELLDNLPEWANQAHALEEFERLPEDKRREVERLASEQKRVRKGGAP